MNVPTSTLASDAGWSESEPSRELWAAAAIRETFKADELLTSWLERHAESSKLERREAMRAIVELQGVGVEGQDAEGAAALRLPHSARRSVLASIGVEGSLNALSELPQDRRTLAERTLADLLERKPVNADRDDGLHLRALKLASGWAEAAGVPTQVVSDELEQQLQRNEFLQLLGGCDLNRFVGRSGVRKLLMQAWREAQGVKWFYIEGPGGIGKSLAVTRFIADLLESDDPPDAVFHLDYDRLALQVAREVTVMQELVKQSARWCAQEAQEDLRVIGLELAPRGTNLESVQLASRSAEAYGLDRVAETLPLLWRRSIRRGAGSRGGSAGARRRIVVFVDSFEQVEDFDTSAAGSPRRALARFSDQRVDVLAICVSRAFSYTPLSNEMKPLRLTQFSVREADIYLTNEATRVGLQVGPGVLREIRAVVGRSPLALRLAVNLLEQSGGTMEAGEWASAALNSQELIQAALYDRLLRRIRDRDLRKLAVPGLLVRRLTAEVIEQVLAGPCDLSLSNSDAQALMAAAQREGQLFYFDQSDPGALRHRQDVRATMLENIERSVAPETVRAINLAAVAYYQRSSADGALAMRVEELYHRLRLDEDAASLDARWVPAAGKLLRSAMQEFPSRARAYLRRKFGAAASDGVAHQAAGRTDYSSGADAEEEFRLYATKELQSGAPPDFILTRWMAEGSRLDVPLGDVYASALLSSGQHDQLLTLARDVMLVRSTKMSPKARSAALAIAAGLLEGRDSLGDAQSHWVQALAAADEATDRTAQLVSLVGCLRIRRKLKGRATARRHDLGRAVALFPSMLDTLYQQHVLARESAAELGELLQSPNERAVPELQRLIGYLAEANELLPSPISDPSRLEYLSTLLFGPSSGIGDSRSLSGAAHKMVYDSPSMAERLTHVLRDEVDWGLRQVARVKPAPTARTNSRGSAA